MTHPTRHITALVGRRDSVRDALSPDALIERLICEAERQQITASEIAKRTGVDFNTCQKLLRRQSRRTSWDTVIRFAEALSVRVEFFDGNGQSLARSDD